MLSTKFYKSPKVITNSIPRTIKIYKLKYTIHLQSSENQYRKFSLMFKKDHQREAIRNILQSLISITIKGHRIEQNSGSKKEKEKEKKGIHNYIYVHI